MNHAVPVMKPNMRCEFCFISAITLELSFFTMLCLSVVVKPISILVFVSYSIASIAINCTLLLMKYVFSIYVRNILTPTSPNVKPTFKEI